VLLRGELDLATVDAVAERLDSLRDRHQAVLLDLDELAFIDVIGMRLLLAAARDSQHDGWPFEVTHGSPPVRRLVELMELREHLPFNGRPA
jgi:anti-anti-sigma factor